MKVESSITGSSTRRYEMTVYAVLWLLVLLLPFVNELIRFIDGRQFAWCGIIRWYIGLIPFVLIFLVNNFILVPKYMLRNKIRTYLIGIVLLVGAFVIYQHFSYEHMAEAIARLNMQIDGTIPAKPRKYSFLGMRMPMVLNLSLLLLLMAVNTLIIMIFKYVREKESRQSIETIHLQDELKFLKAQINPHFFMNMLNSIHAMIELDSVKAQELTIELSKMMRYVLYGSDRQTLSLADEVGFIVSYISLLSQRYPKSKVEINLDVPSEPSNSIVVPPLVFVTFIENAFKHGISYNRLSVIDVKLQENEGKVIFTCFNTKPQSQHPAERGIGLQNVIRRLDLLYSDRYSLSIEDKEETYMVKLEIPGL